VFGVGVVGGMVLRERDPARRSATRTGFAAEDAARASAARPVSI